MDAACSRSCAQSVPVRSISHQPRGCHRYRRSSPAIAARCTSGSSASNRGPTESTASDSDSSHSARTAAARTKGSVSFSTRSLTAAWSWVARLEKSAAALRGGPADEGVRGVQQKEVLLLRLALDQQVESVNHLLRAIAVEPFSQRFDQATSSRARAVPSSRRLSNALGRDSR